MEGVSNQYIDEAITTLLGTIGVKECVDADKLLSLIQSGKVGEAIKEIAWHLGVPIAVNLSYVSNEYGPGSTGDFRSQGFVKTDWRGRGTSGIVAQVSIPSNGLPRYGFINMVNFPINVRISDRCVESPLTFITVMAHELSHVVLHSMRHSERESEFHTDLTAMVLGFANVMKRGRKLVTTKTQARMRTTTTTTVGYLSDDNFDFAFSRVQAALKIPRAEKENAIREAIAIEAATRRQKKDVYVFALYLDILDRNLRGNISRDVAQEICRYHQVGFTDEFEAVAKKAELEIGKIISSLRDLQYYDARCFEDIVKFKARLRDLSAEVNSKHRTIKNAIAMLKTYVPLKLRLQAFLSERLHLL